MKFPFDNTYARLPAPFFAAVKPTPVKAPKLVKVNAPLAELLGLDPAALSSDAGARIFSGNELPEGAEPIALAYAGHQFGGFVPRLGDGRAILLGEIVGKDGKRRDVQLKGAGRTPFSRGGDGRAAVGPVLREYVVSEAMAALGIPTTRALAAVTTGEHVAREGYPPGAIVTRVASSHMRVGTFQYLAALQDEASLVTLTKFAVERHYPESVAAENVALALLDGVMQRQGELVAAWMGVGFVHGVMNTDNSSISGETIDYGPCAFLDEYSPRKKFSSIDVGGRYAFGNQSTIALWNLARLAETLLPQFAESEEESVQIATARLERFPAIFETARLSVMRAKLGLATSEDGDTRLVDVLLERMASSEVDWTVFFRQLSTVAFPAGTATDEQSKRNDEIASLFSNAGAFHDWAEEWRQRLARDDRSNEARAAAMKQANPAFIPRNHRIEEMIQAAATREDYAPFERLLSVLARPFDDQPEAADLATPPQVNERVRETFCGT
jgi:uncharacterized protein YdiU (UPF0061 family)